MARNSDQLLKANIKLQIKNLENDIYELVDRLEEAHEKIDYLKSKLKKLAGTKSGKRQAKK